MPNLDPSLAERFEILAVAGSGGMGAVYRARDKRTGTIVALKVLRDTLIGDPRRFEREASVLAELDHPAIVRYVDHGIADDGAPFLAMEWLAGQDLDTRLARGPISIADVVTLARTVAEALAAAHRRGIVHRDLKPANVFLVDGNVAAAKVLDFGLARRIAEEGLTATGEIMGTPAYMAPEQVRGANVDARADVYALGALIFRCIVGRAPHGGVQRVAILAKIVLEEAPRLRELQSGVPAALDELVARMLAKDPADRPASGDAVVAALADIDGDVPPRAATVAITDREQRIACVVLAGGSGADDATLPSREASQRDDLVHSAVAERGGFLEVLARGTWLVTVRAASSLAEQASRAARCALAIAELRSGSPVVVATGRVLVAGNVQVGEVIDRAAQALVAAQADREGGVRVDAATADLLDDRFDVGGEGTWRPLAREREGASAVRTLLGKPATCAGRTQELAALEGALDGTIEDSESRVVLVVAPPGLGKSRLVHELVTARVPARGPVEVLFARGDAVRAGSPFGAAGEIVRRLAGIDDAKPLATRRLRLRAFVGRCFRGDAARRIEEMLGEIANAAALANDASPALRAARADSELMVQAIRDAFVELLDALASRTPLVAVLEDVHAFDAPTIRLIDAALDVLAGRPFLVLATARPEVRTKWPDLWKKRRLHEVHLGPISARASEAIVRGALGSDVPADVTRAIVTRAGGHPFLLEEIVRGVASGRGPDALPDTIVGIIQARLDVLGSDAKRVVRAASVLGERFSARAVAALVGDGAFGGDLPSILALLADEEIFTRSGGTRANDPEYAFRHALVRDAAYSTLTEQDRTLAHLLAGSWLEENGGADPAVLAEHFDRGAAPRRASAHFARAARLAVERGDLDRASEHASRAIASGADDTSRVAMIAVKAEVDYWRGALDEAAERASEAAIRLPPGSADWFDAASVSIGAHGQRGRNDEVARWLERAAFTEAADDARGRQIVALCRGLVQLYWAHYRGDLRTVRARLDGLFARADPPDSYEAGWVERVRAESAWLHDAHVDRAREHFDASLSAFERAHAMQSACLVRINAASIAAWSGDIARAESLLARSDADAEKIGAGFLSRYVVAVRGLVGAYAGDPAAEETMRRAYDLVAKGPRLAFVASAVVAWEALLRGDVDASDEYARIASAIDVVDDLRPASHALRARILLARGDVAGAIAEARRAVEIRRSRADLELTEGLAELALAEALDASGDRAGAGEALLPAARRLATIATTIADPVARERFWSRRFANDRIRALARTVGIDPYDPS